MRIAIFAKSTLAHGAGGMETHLENLKRELVVLGHAVQVVTTRHPAGVTVEESSGLRVQYLREAPPRRYSRAWWRVSLGALKELMSEGPIDLVLSESLAAASVARAVRRPPVYPFIYGLVFSHLRTEWRESTGLRQTCRFLGIKLPEMAYYASVYERPFLKKVEAVLATYDQLALTLARQGRRVFVSYNGVDVRQFSPDQERRRQVRERLGIAEDEFVVLLAGVMTRQKGMHLGIEALDPLAGRFPGLRLLVVGNGPEEGTLRALGSRLRLGPRIDFIGGLAHHEMPRYMNAADVFVHPSLRAEGLPTVIVEAMASGLPVVATDTGGTSTAVVDGRTGILVPPGDVGKLTTAIEALMTDQGLATKLAAEGLSVATERFAWSQIVQRLLADLAKSGSGSTRLPEG